MKKACNYATFLAIVTLLISCATPRSHDNLNSTLWMQTAVEYRAVTIATYQTAAARLDEALMDKKWTAALEQTGAYGHLPPAVILDIDETVLDNSPFQGELIIENLTYSPDAWDQWISMAKAVPVPGAHSFIEEAKKRGIRVIYITNRKCRRRAGDPSPCPQETDTIHNLMTMGFPEIDPQEEMLLQGEQSGWTGEKSSRRRQVGQKFRILMLIGDDLGDFISNVKQGTPEERAERAAPFDAYWGSKWFILPNPTYGSWYRILAPPKVRHLEGYR